METVAYPCLVMASVNIFVGLYHLFVYLRRRQSLVNLPFALLCFSVAAYDIFCIGLYDSHTTAQGVFWQGLQLRTVYLISVFLIWFVTVFTAQKNKRLVLLLTGWFVAALVASVLMGPALTLSPLRPSTKTIILGSLSVTYYEGELGIFYSVGIASAILTYLYFLVALIRDYRRTGDKSRLVIIAGLLAYFAGIVNDSAVASRLYSFVYVSEYAFMVIVLAMSYVLLNEFVTMSRAVEEANSNLEEKIRARTREIEMLSDELRRQAQLDALTGIYNRRFFNEYLAIELRRARNRVEHGIALSPGANDMSFGLAIIDVDHFKQVNDTLGHPAGDHLLVALVQRIQGTIFSRDVFCRYGGEEFVVLFTRTFPEGIESALEKIRKSVEEPRFALPEAPEPLRVTVSIGAAILDSEATMTGEEFLRRADERLLAAKSAGRNKVVFR